MKKKFLQLSSGPEYKKMIFLSVLLFLIALAAYGQKGWTQTYFSGPKYHIGAALGTKVYYPGGMLCDQSSVTSKVEIYDTANENWDTTQNLSVARGLASVTATDSKVFVAGGIASTGSSAVVDIFDTLSGNWTVGNLSVARFGAAAVSKDNIAVFAGGFTVNNLVTTNVVDIYNDGVWTTATLSESRYVGAAVVVGDLAMFAGGYDAPNVSKRIDIYNFSTGEWSIDSLSVARCNLAGTVIGNKAFFAGGTSQDGESSDLVDIYDDSTGEWTTDHLSFARAFTGGGFLNAATVCGKAFFVNGGKLELETNKWIAKYDIIDIFDSIAGNWSTGFLPNQNHRVNHSVVGVDSFLLVAGGSPCQKAVDILEVDCPPPVGVSSIDQKPDYSIFPNPAREKLNINASFKNRTSGSLLLYDLTGHAVYQYEFKDDHLSHQIDLKPFTPGLYVVEIRTDGGKIVEKVIIQE